jgi:hypothetical protein
MANFDEKEKRIKEQRTIEATKKGLMGASGKFGVIVRNLGQPIISHNSGDEFYNSSYLDDPYELDAPNSSTELKPGSPEEIQNQIPYMGSELDEPTGFGWKENRQSHREGSSMVEIGWLWDGLRGGMHLEIKYLDESKELTVHHGGYLVYQEVAGDLTRYLPNEDWELLINRVYLVAKKKEQSKKRIKKEERTNLGERIKKNWLQRMRDRWGI